MFGYFWRHQPKITIKYGKLLDPIFIFYCKNNPDLKAQGWNDWVPPSQEEVLKRIEGYKAEWSKNERKILNALSRISGLGFKRNTIDVYVVSGNPRQLSEPLVIKSGYSPSEFTDSLTHELLHKLFADNSDVFPSRILDEMFPGETQTVKNHVITHALLKYIYLDVLKEPERLARNIQVSSKHGTSEYSRAWEIVEEKGYKNLINDWRAKIKRGSSMFR